MKWNSQTRKLVLKLLAWPLGAVILGIILLTLSITMPGDAGNDVTDIFRILFGIIHFPVLLSQNFLGWPTGGVGFIIGFALDGFIWLGIVTLIRRLMVNLRKDSTGGGRNP